MVLQLVMVAVTEGRHRHRPQPESAGDVCTPSVRKACGESSLVAEAVEPASQLRYG